MRIIIGAIICSLLLFPSCKKTDRIGSPTAAVIIKEIGYGNNPKQKMDLYLPPNRSLAATKVLLLIHGGAWIEGDKTDFDSYVSILQSRFPDYAIVNINYRLVTNNQNLFPAQENDIKAAVDFVASKRKDYLISDSWVFLGASAGGQLALLQSYKYASPIVPKAVVSFFGPTDLTQLYNNPPIPIVPFLLYQVTGTTPSLNGALYQQSSPVSFVTAGSCPTLLLQGGRDSLVPLSQATLLKDKLQSVGVLNQLVIYPDEGHGWVGEHLNDSFNKIEAFLKQNVH